MVRKIKNNYIIKKAIINLFIILIGAVSVTYILRSNQEYLIRSDVQEESQEILEQVSNTLINNREDAQTLTNIYHKLNQSTATDLKEVFTTGLFNYLYTSDKTERAEVLTDITSRANIQYLFLMNEEGKVFAAPDEQFINKNLVDEDLLSVENLTKLVQNGNVDFHVLEKNESGSYYFYSDVLETEKGTYYLVYGTNATILDTQFASLTDVTRILKDIEVGENGFVFAVDKKDKSFIYYHDKNGELTGKNIFDYGLTETALKDQYVGQQKINGTDYYCVSKDCGDYMISTAATDIDAMYSTDSHSWKWSIAGFIGIALMCMIYATIVRNDFLFNERNSKKIKLFTFSKTEHYLNISILKRIFPVILLGVLIIFGISFYSRTLIDINKAIATSNTNINELEVNFVDANITKDIVKEYYENQYLAKAKILAYLFEENPEVLNVNRNKQYYTYTDSNARVPIYDDEENLLYAVSNSSLLEEYCQRNNIKSIYLFDDQGRTIATNEADWYFQLSFDKEDQSYPFRDILDQKTDYYIQDMGEDEQGNTSQYLGTAFTYYTTTDESGNTLYVSRYDYQREQEGTWEGNPITKHQSLLQIGLNTDIMDNILASTDYEYILENSAVDKAYLVLFEANDDHTVLYSPREESIGKKASEINLNDNAFNGNYIGFQKVNGNEYLIDIQYYEGYYIGTAILEDYLFINRGLIAFVTALFGLVFILLMVLILILTNEEEEKIYVEYTERVSEFSDRIMFRISTPSGEGSITEKALSRWDNKNIPWNERTPEQKLIFIFFITMALSIVNILLFTFMVQNGTVNDSAIAYILTGNWDKGFNVFAITACGLILIFAIVVAQCLNIPIHLTTKIFGTKSETIGHLLTSVIKYVTTIYSIFYCLYLLGFNSTSLLTSAGILSLVIGLGSQSLIKDVVAGIFIIFEGEFRVGDIVKISDYRGQVLDVGLRTTKIMSSDHNIKIINNSDVNGVINMTRVSSVCTIDVPIAFGIPMNEVEEILNKELPLVKEKIEDIIDGPYYTGVDKFDHNKITIQVSVLCKEKNIQTVRSDLNKQVLNIIYRNSLHKPRLTSVDKAN